MSQMRSITGNLEGREIIAKSSPQAIVLSGDSVFAVVFESFDGLAVVLGETLGVPVNDRNDVFARSEVVVEVEIVVVVFDVRNEFFFSAVIGFVGVGRVIGWVGGVVAT